MSIAFPIIISLAVAALFVLRFVDRNNRSLEKIKRYTDKVKGDLDKYVGERTDELKNIGIEVDVHQKASREIIKKIEAFEQRLAEKNDTLENVFSRIEDYDRAIADLVSMTERVDENLLRLKQESEFVEEVSIRLSKAKNSVSALEKAIPEVERYFEQSNNESLQNLWNGVKGDLESEMAGLSEKMNDVKFSVGEFSDFVRHLEDKRVEMEASALESLQKDIENAYNSAEMKADQLKDDIKQDVAGIMEQLQTSSASLKDFFDNRDGEIKGRFEEYSQKAEAIEDKCRNFLSDADKALSTGSRNLKELVARADSAAAQLDEKVSIVDSLNLRVEEYQQRVAELDAAASGFDKQIAALKKDSAFVDSVSKRVKEASAEFASIEKKIPTLLADFSDTNRKQLEILSSSVRSDIEQKLENVESRVSSSAVLAEEYCGKVSRAFVQAEQDSEALTSSVKDDISAIYNEIRASHGEFLNQDISKVRELRESLDTEIKKHLSAFNEAGTHTINSINDAAERQNKVIEETVSQAGSTINEMKTGYREFADKVNSDIDNSRKEIQELYQSSESIRAELTDKSQEISEMYEKIQAYDSSLAQLKTL
jgi:chromosome segregation ATPase